jgi:hypothetical protein
MVLSHLEGWTNLFSMVPALSADTKAALKGIFSVDASNELTQVFLNYREEITVLS